MRLAARSRIVGALALAVTAAALSPGTSAGYRLTHQEIARLAQQSRQDPQSVAQAPVVRPNPDQQAAQASVVEPPILPPGRGSQFAAVSRAKSHAEAARTQSPPPHSHYSSAGTNGHVGTVRPVATSAPTGNTPGDGFAYGDAAVGAGIAAAIVLLATTVILTVRRRSQPQHS